MESYHLYILLLIFLNGQNGQCGITKVKCTSRYFCDFSQGVFACNTHWKWNYYRFKGLNLYKILTCYDKTYDITSLNLQNNGIDYLKTGRKISNNVSEINLSNNSLSDLTGTMFYSFERLKSLDVSYNHIWYSLETTFIY